MDLAVIPPLYGTGDVVNESEVMKVPGSQEETPDARVLEGRTPEENPIDCRRQGSRLV